MNLIIFGATGTVGRQLVEQALAQGHRVTAFARTPAALGVDHPHLTRKRGDVLDRDAVLDAVKGHDAVLVALGSGRKGTVRSVGTRHVVDAMSRGGIRRLVCLTSLGVGDSRAALNFFWRRIMFGILLRQAYADHEAQEACVRDSDLDWTIVRPAAFTEAPAGKDFKHGFAPTEKHLKLKITRADVAQFMLRQLADATYLRQSPGLSY